MDSEEKEEKASIISSTKTTFNSFSKKPPLPKLTRTFSVEETHKKISIHKSTNFLIRTTTQSKSKLRNYSMKKMKIQVTQPQVSAQGYCAMFSDSNQIILSGKIFQPRQIASLTKLMTAFTVINLCNIYGIKIRDHSIFIHQEAAMMQGTSANLTTGDQVRIMDLLYALMLPSGNDAGIALAQYFGKFLSHNIKENSLMTMKMQENMNNFKETLSFYDEEYQSQSINLFIFEMNNNAKKMQLKKTKFSNPTGLNNIQNYSTPYDLAILTSYCLKNHCLRSLMKRKIYKCTVKNDKLGSNRLLQWKNTNRHLFQIRECIGGKTGITPSAGPCLSSVYRIKGRELIVILLGCYSMEERYKDAQCIYKWARWKALEDE